MKIIFKIIVNYLYELNNLNDINKKYKFRKFK